MKEILNVIRLIVTGIGAATGALLGGWDGFLYALLTVVAMDYLTGVLAAAVNCELSSRTGARGIAKKLAMFCIVALGYVIDQKILRQGGAIRTAVIFFYLSNEGISILENASRIGLPFPEKLLRVLKELKPEEEEKNDKDDKDRNSRPVDGKPGIG